MSIFIKCTTFHYIHFNLFPGQTLVSIQFLKFTLFISSFILTIDNCCILCAVGIISKVIPVIFTQYTSKESKYFSLSKDINDCFIKDSLKCPPFPASLFLLSQKQYDLTYRLHFDGWLILLFCRQPLRELLYPARKPLLYEHETRRL